MLILIFMPVSIGSNVGLYCVGPKSTGELVSFFTCEIFFLSLGFSSLCADSAIPLKSDLFKIQGRGSYKDTGVLYSKANHHIKIR